MKERISRIASETPLKGLAGFALAWTCISWGTSWVVAKIGVSQMPALQMAGMRQLFASMIFLIFFILKKHPWPRGRQWFPVIILSFLNFMISNGLSTWGVKYISSGLAAIIGAIFPLWLAIIILFKGSTIPRLAVIGILLGFAGICIIFSDHLMDFLNPEFRFGIVLSIISTISWAFGTLYTKSEAANFNPYFSLGLQMFISGTILFSISQATGQWISFSEIPSDSWLAIFYLVIVSSVITFIAYLYALQKLPTALASVYAYINPIVAVLLGAYFLGEKLNIFIAIGGAVTLFGVYLVNNAFKKSKAAEPVQGSIE